MQALRKRRPRALLTGALVAGLAAIAVPPPGAEANWLTKAIQEAGEAGSRTARHGAGALERGALHLKSLPPSPKGTAALAAHVTPEGHWKFANRAGETFTAGTPDELKRVAAVLAPDAAGGEGRLALHLSEDSVFGWRRYLKDLPKAELHVLVGKDSYRIARRGSGEAERLFAEVRPNIVVELGERKLFDEAVWQLARPLARSPIRVLSLEPGGPQTLARAPRLDPATRRAGVDAVDPYKLPAALASLKGQAALVVGRVEGGFLHFRPASGTERPLLLNDLMAAAEKADVNLVVLHSAQPRQPGGRNWLWQRMDVAGLEDAMKRATLSDFLDVLGAGRGELAVSASAAGSGRVTLRAVPTGGSAIPMTGAIGEWAREAVGNVTGNIVTTAVEAHMRSSERQQEIDIRLIPFLPATLQMAYLAALVAGVVGIARAWGWWNRIWPPEQRAEYGGAFGYHAARVTKGLMFLLLFLPLAGPFALLALLLAQAWSILTAPARLVRWLMDRRREAAAG